MTGADFGESFTSSLVPSVVALGLADAQNEIGDIFNDEHGNPINGGEGSIGHVLLHSLAGCAAAEAQGADCAAGAAGGIAQALYSGPIGNTGLTDDQQRDQAELIGALVGYAVSGGNAVNVSIASAIALSGVINNRQLHRSEAEWIHGKAAEFAV